MLDKCANPLCFTPLHYLREGKVYRVEVRNRTRDTGLFLVLAEKPKPRPQHYWLCGECMSQMSLHFDQEGRPSVVPKMVKIVAAQDSAQPNLLAKKAAAS